ncbi:hypothetical protein ACEPPN_004802 [Leptodophora sp. 'Broadleaf-Isolate-01']
MAQGDAEESMSMGSLKTTSTSQSTKSSKLIESSDHITNPRQLQKIIRSLRIDIRQKDTARNTDKAKHAKQMEQNSKDNAKLRKENQRLQDLLSARSYEGQQDTRWTLLGCSTCRQPRFVLDNHLEAKKSTVFDIDAHWYEMGDKVSRLLTEIEDFHHDNGKLQPRINQMENTARDATKAKENAKRKAHERLLREEKTAVEALRESKQLRKAVKHQEGLARFKDRKIERVPTREMETRQEPGDDMRESEVDGEGEMEGDEDVVEDKQSDKGILKDHAMDGHTTEAVLVQAKVLAKSLGSGKRGLQDFEDVVGGNHVLAKRFRGDLHEQDKRLSRMS